MCSHFLICLYYLFQVVESSALSLFFFTDQLDQIQQRSYEMQHVQTIVEIVSICGLATTHAGLFNRLLNCTGDRNATGTYILEQSFLNTEEFENVLVHLHQVGQDLQSRMNKVHFYQVKISKKALSHKREPKDDSDLVEFEKDQTEVGSSIHDVIQPRKKYFAIIGPDMTDLSSLATIDL